MKDRASTQVRYVAELARLELAPAEEERLTGQLNAILEYMGQLAEVDTAGVEPTSHVLPLTNVLREDVVRARPHERGGARERPGRRAGALRRPEDHRMTLTLGRI